MSRLGLRHLDTLVQEYLVKGLSQSTRAVYSSGWRKYLEFCAAFSIHPLPITEYSQASFAAYLAGKLNWKTIRSYLAATRFYRIKSGLPDPSLSPTPKLTYVLKGIRKQSPGHVRPPRMPLTPQHLHRIYDTWTRTTPSFDKQMLWAAFCIGFFGFMRSGEFTSVSGPNETCLQVSDVSIDSRDNPQVLTIFLKKSKTDQFGQGSHIHIGRTGDVLCPVSATLAYLAVRPNKPGPLFVFENGSPLSQRQLVNNLRIALTEAGVDATHFTGHSFRIGAATTAATAGINDSTIKTLGRWKSEAFHSYIRQRGDNLASAVALLSRTHM